VRIWFDGPVETMFLEIRVETEDKRLDKKDARRHPDDATLVEVGFPRLPAGRYRVFSGVVARDGHRREDSFSLLVKEEGVSPTTSCGRARTFARRRRRWPPPRR
jgi:methionine-rich copper-binding protein CopC